MKIEILGTGCPKCKKLYELVQEAVKETGSNAEVVKVEDIQHIMNMGVMMTPALVIDGEVKTTGKIPKIDDIEKWIQKPGS
ncbi:MAG: thioredoxin family protein [bacterium]